MTYERLVRMQLERDKKIAKLLRKIASVPRGKHDAIVLGEVIVAINEAASLVEIGHDHMEQYLKLME